MTQDWIMDVLADLRSFAVQNEMKSLAEQLDDTLLVAASEIAQAERADDRIAGENVSGARRVSGRPQTSEIA